MQVSMRDICEIRVCRPIRARSYSPWKEVCRWIRRNLGVTFERTSRPVYRIVLFFTALSRHNATSSFSPLERPRVMSRLYQTRTRYCRARKRERVRARAFYEMLERVARNAASHRAVRVCANISRDEKCAAWYVSPVEQYVLPRYFFTSCRVAFRPLRNALGF